MARLRESESSKKNYLKTGAEYIASMRDERVVYCGGEVIEDVTKHPATAGGIEIIGRLYDQQHQPAYEDVLTYTRDDGARTTMAFKPPRTTADLRERSRAIEHIARETFGFFGRGIDMIPMAHVGMVAEYPAFKRMAPEFADNIFSYMQYAEENNLHLAETISEPQGFRARTTGTSPDTEMPDRAVTRITRESSKGIWISGIKAVGTAAPQAHEVVVGRPFPSPREDECFWAIAAANAPGVRMFSREILANPDASPETHPITVRGEEQECLVAFDDVFIPRERIFSLRCKEAHEPRFFLRFARLEHWYTLTRMVVKAELYVGLVQLVCDVLNITESQVVRQRVAEVIQYAQILRGLALASEENAEITEGDVAMPDANLVTAATAIRFGAAAVDPAHYSGSLWAGIDGAVQRQGSGGAVCVWQKPRLVPRHAARSGAREESGDELGLGCDLQRYRVARQPVRTSERAERPVPQRASVS